MLSGHTPSLSNIPRMQEIFFQRQQSFDVFMLLTGTVTGLIRAGVVSRPVMSMGEDEALVCYGLLWKQGLMGTILCVIMCHALPSEGSHRIETPKVDSTMELPACYWLNLSLSSSHSFTACVQYLFLFGDVVVIALCEVCYPLGKERRIDTLAFGRSTFFSYTKREKSTAQPLTFLHNCSFFSVSSIMPWVSSSGLFMCVI